MRGGLVPARNAPRLLLGVLALAACGDNPAGPTVSQLLASCVTDETGSWTLTRGYYTDSFPGRRLDSIQAYFAAETAGDYTFRLTIRQSTYDGAVLGTATAAPLTLIANPDAFVLGTFGFPNTPVTRGSIVTLDFEVVSGAGGPSYVQGSEIEGCRFQQTEDKTPPRSTDTYVQPRIALYGLP
jgi:hypothetical protein